MEAILSQTKIDAHLEFEDSFRSGYNKFVTGANQMALALHNIQRFGTWQVAVDSEGEYFRNWTSYVEWLADDVGLGRSTIFSYKSAMEFVIANSYAVAENGELDYDRFIDRGGVLTFRRIRSSTITDRSGAVVGLKGVDVDDPAGVIEEVVNTIDPQSRPMDQMRYIKEAIQASAGKNDVVNVELRLRTSDEGGYNLVWVRESGSGITEGLVSRGPIPDDVERELKEKFFILT